MLIKTLHGPCRHVQPRPVFVKALTSIWMLLLLMAPCAVFVPMYIFCVRQAHRPQRPWTVSLRPAFPAVVGGGYIKKTNKKKIIIYQVCVERKHQQKKRDGTERSCFLFSACVGIQIYPFASLPMDPGWSAANVPAGEAMRNGCGRSWWVGGAWSWLVGSPGSADDIGNSTAESWRCTLMSHRARGHAGKVSLSLSLSLPYTDTCKSAHTCAQAGKLILMWEAQVLHL